MSGAWVLILLFLAVSMIILEMFIPSGGILSILAVAAVIGSIGMAFVAWGSGYGTLYFGAVVLSLPFLGALLVRWWPSTPIGRKILNRTMPEVGEPSKGDAPSQSEKFKSLIGQKGIAQSKMLPSGCIDIAGHSYDAISDGSPIEMGQVIEVVRVRGNSIVVRPAAMEGVSQHASKDDDDQQLDRPTIEDPFQEPLA